MFHYIIKFQFSNKIINNLGLKSLFEGISNLNSITSLQLNFARYIIFSKFLLKDLSCDQMEDEGLLHLSLTLSKVIKLKSLIMNFAK